MAAVITTQALASIIDVACHQISIVPVSHKIVMNGTLDVKQVEAHLYENNEDYDGTLDELIHSLTWDTVILPDVKKLVINNSFNSEYTYTHDTPDGVTVRALVESVVKVRLPASQIFASLRFVSDEDGCRTYKAGFFHGTY
jgi:hypothetical protein